MKKMVIFYASLLIACVGTGLGLFVAVLAANEDINQYTFLTIGMLLFGEIVIVCFLFILIQKINELSERLNRLNYSKIMLQEDKKEFLTPIISQPQKPSWEELSEEKQKTFIENAIKQLYEGQLKDTNLELTRQQRALKKNSLEMKEFYIEDLTEEEKVEVLKLAQENYENGNQNSNEQRNQQIDDSGRQDKKPNEKFIKSGFKWFILNSMISTTARNRSRQTATINNGKIELEDNSNKASAIRPCGKCTGVSGEKPIDFVVGLNPFTKTFSCCGAFKGFSFKADDIKEYRMISSNSKSEKYELIHNNGKKISLSLTPLGAELLNAVLGNEKLSN